MSVVRTGEKNDQEIPYFLKITSIHTGSWARAEANMYFLKICARWNANSPKGVSFSMHRKIKVALSFSHLILSPSILGRLQSRYQKEKKGVMNKSREKSYHVLLIYTARRI